MIEELGIGDHSCVFKVLSEASGDQVNVNPSDVLRSEDFDIEKLGIFFGNVNEFSLLSKNSLSFFLYTSSHPGVLQILELRFLPECHVVDISWEIL